MLKLKHDYYDEKIGKIAVFTGNVFNIRSGKPCMVIRSEKTGADFTMSADVFERLVFRGQIKKEYVG